MRPVLFALLSVMAGCAPDEVEVPLAELPDPRLTVSAQTLSLAPAPSDLCHVLASDAVTTFNGTVATLTDPGGYTSEGSWSYSYSDDTLHRDTIETCDPAVWSIPAVVPAGSDLTVEVADATAAYRATYVDAGRPLSLRFLEAAVVDGRTVKRFAVEPATHSVSIGYVVAKPGPGESWVPDRYFDARRVGERTIEVTYPRAEDPVPPGPYVLRLDWTPRLGECSFKSCSITSRRIEHPLD